METRGRQAWRDALRDRSFLLEAIVTAVVVVVGLVGYSHYLGSYVEVRRGATIADPILALFDPMDLSALSFILIYGALVVAVLFLLREPRRFLHFAQAYVLVILFRSVSLYLLPLEPPPDMIPLVDPVVGAVVGGTTLTRDLFFSGHTATMFLLAVSAKARWLRGVFLVATAGIAAGVLLQHVHYTIDVVVAPFVAFFAWKIVRLGRSD